MRLCLEGCQILRFPSQQKRVTAIHRREMLPQRQKDAVTTGLTPFFILKRVLNKHRKFVQANFAVLHRTGKPHVV